MTATATHMATYEVGVAVTSKPPFFSSALHSGCMEKKETENGRRKAEREDGNGKRKRKTEISQLCKVNDHYHSVFFAVVKVDSRRCICKGVLWGSLSI